MTAPTRATLRAMPPLRAPAGPTRAQLLELARRGWADGDSLGAQSVERVAALAAALAENSALHRQLELRIDALVISAVFPDPAPEFPDDPTQRRRPAIVRRDPHTAPTKVLGAQDGARP